jgi:hypothetical protein
MHLTYILDGFRPKDREDVYSGWKASDDRWRGALARCGIGFDYIAAEALRGDDLQFAYHTSLARTLDDDALCRYRVLVLPYTLALSDRSAQRIAKFVRQGGTVLADVLPGLTDERGTPRTNAADGKNLVRDLFGAFTRYTGMCHGDTPVQRQSG